MGISRDVAFSMNRWRYAKVDLDVLGTTADRISYRGISEILLSDLIGLPRNSVGSCETCKMGSFVRSVIAEAAGR